MPCLASAHPSAHFKILKSSIFIKQILNEVDTKSMKIVIFRWWATFNELIYWKNVQLEGFKCHVWLQPVLPLISGLLNLLFSLCNYKMNSSQNH